MQVFSCELCNWSLPIPIRQKKLKLIIGTSDALEKIDSPITHNPIYGETSLNETINAHLSINFYRLFKIDWKNLYYIYFLVAKLRYTLYVSHDRLSIINVFYTFIL